MSRVKTFDSTGLATSGRLYAGDLNSIQDQYADLVNLAQALSVGSVAIGESGLQLLRYGAGEARISGAFRADGIIRALGGLYGGAFTTAARNSIAAGFRPYGLIILNTDNNRYEWNIGTDISPSWVSLGGGSFSSGTLLSRPSATAANANTFYFATDDNGGTIYASNGSTWVKLANGLTQAATTVVDGAITAAKLAPITISVKATSYSLVVADRFTTIRMDGGGTLTVPLSSAQPFSIGDSVDILQYGASQVTITPTAGVTLTGNPGLKTNGQYTMASLLKLNTDTWVAVGNLTT